jgi:hypothetical protein
MNYAVLCSALLATTSFADTEPRAETIVREMRAYLASLESFEVEAEAAGVDSRISVRRPDGFRSEPVGPGARMTIWYDGKALTLYCATASTYATAPAAGDIVAALDLARTKDALHVPAAELLLGDPDDVEIGRYLGIETLDGVPSHHVAFRTDGVDWEIWVNAGREPVPLRFVVTSPTQPALAVRLVHWNTHAALPPATFYSELPPGTKRVDTLSTCPAARR